MNVLTQAIYDRLSGDPTLVASMATYQGAPAIFTTDPAPGDAVLPYIVSAGNVTDSAFDTKLECGRRIGRDVRCYAAPDGDAILIEQLAERVRVLLHRYVFHVPGFGVWIAEASGPIAADEPAAYGRIVTIRYIMMEE